MAFRKFCVLALMIVHVHVAEGALLRSAAARSLAAGSSAVPDPHCKIGVISLSGQSCCAGYCGACNDYETCKSVNGQDSENACCASKIYKMRCGNAPANVCLRKCSEAMPPCIMDKDVDAMPVKAMPVNGVPPCNKVVPFTANIHAVAITKGHFMADLHVTDLDLQESLEIVKSARAKLQNDAKELDVPQNISTEYDAAIKRAEELLANVPKSISKVQELKKEVIANKVGENIPHELELEAQGEENNEVSFRRDAEEVEQASQSLHEQVLDYHAMNAAAKVASDAKENKAKLQRKLRELLKKRLQAPESMWLQKKHDARANSTEKLDASMEIATIVKHDKRLGNNRVLALPTSNIDIDSASAGMKSDLGNNVNVLQGHVDSMKPILKEAKEHFKTDRKNIRDQYKSCKKEIKHDKKTWKKSWQCAPFASYFPTLLEVQGGDEEEDEEVLGQDAASSKGSKRALLSRRAVLEEEGFDDEDEEEQEDEEKLEEHEDEDDGEERSSRRRRDSRRRRRDSRRRRESKSEKKSDKSKKKSEKKAKKEAKCSERPECALRQARRVAKQSAKDDYKKVQKTCQSYKKQLRQAKFQSKILPDLIILVEPLIHMALKKVGWSSFDTSVVKACVEAQKNTTGCIPLLEIDGLPLLKNYMNLQLNTVLGKVLGKVFDDVEHGIWKIFDPLMNAIKNSIVGEVGSIPFIGGALAVAVDMLFDLLYGIIRKAVDMALNKLEAILQADIVAAIEKAVEDTKLFTAIAMQDQSQKAKLGSAMETAGNGAVPAPVSSTQKQMTDESTTAQAAAQKATEGHQAAITSAGTSTQQEDSEDSQESQDMYQSEDEQDDKDES